MIKNKKNNKIHPWYITGLIDGDGSLNVSVTKASYRSIGYIVTLSFEIALLNKDIKLLENLKDYFKTGSIYGHIGNMKRYKVSSVKSLTDIILPHFDKYPLITKKKSDFEIFKRIVIILNKGPIDKNQLINIISLKASLNKGLSSKLSNSFNATPFIKPNFQLKKVPNSLWVIGFTEAEGSFNILLVKNSHVKTGMSVRLTFALTQHSRDKELLISFINYFKCGSYSPKNFNSAGDYRVNSLKDICDKIIPFFEKYSFLGSKSLSFKKFCQVAKLMQKKDHLNGQGLQKIKNIKLGII